MSGLVVVLGLSVVFIGLLLLSGLIAGPGDWTAAAAVVWCALFLAELWAVWGLGVAVGWWS